MPKIYTKLVFSSNLHLYKLQLNTSLEDQLKTTVFLNICKKEKNPRAYMKLSSRIPNTETWQGWSGGEVVGDIKALGLANGQRGPWQILQHLEHTSDHPESPNFCVWCTHRALPFHPDTPFSIRTSQEAIVFLTVRSEPAYRMDSSYLPTTAVFGKQRQQHSNWSDSNKSKFSVHLKAEKCLDTHTTDVKMAVSELPFIP